MNMAAETIDQATGEILPAVYPAEIVTAIAKVMGADLYIQKRGKNAFHGYKYATVGDILDKIQPLMSEAGLVIFQDEGPTEFLDEGNVMATRYWFTLAHISGAVWPQKFVHTGMSACRNSKGGFDDKAANKCHTAARKYFILGLFQIPTGEDFRQAAHDADADAHGDPLPREAPPLGARKNGAKPADDRAFEMEALAKAIRDDIDTSASLNELNRDMLERGQSLTSPDPKPESDLAKIKAFSETAFQFLTDRANKRRGMLASAPPKEAA